MIPCCGGGCNVYGVDAGLLVRKSENALCIILKAVATAENGRKKNEAKVMKRMK